MDITRILSAAAALVSAVITTFLVPWLRTKLGEQKFSRAMEWVQIAVHAAEQIYTGPGRGAEKKAYVLSLLADEGITFDSRVIEALLESEVSKIKEEVR